MLQFTSLDAREENHVAQPSGEDREVSPQPEVSHPPSGINRISKMFHRRGCGGIKNNSIST